MEKLTWGVLDLLLVAGLLLLAWTSLTTRDLRRAIVLFIAFGLLLALVWVRLRAPDIALAEAAIGAGLTGALLLSAWRDERSKDTKNANANDQTDRPESTGILLNLLSLALAVILGVAFLSAIEQADPLRLAPQVFAQLEHSGVSNPVTAVLLNFRAYDTLLELAVLLTALLGILALGPPRSVYLPAGAVFAGLTRWLVPLLILVSGYLLWVGAQAPGGAFQAGALLAAAGVLLRLAGHPTAGLPAGFLLRALGILGVAVFLLTGLTLMLLGRAFLDYPETWAGTLILLIETAATLGIAVTLVLAFMGGEPVTWTRSQPSMQARKQRG
jgi:multisubunit Na+/H+ antiporter MnhB subunit